VHRGEELGRGRCPAPVMADLEEIGAQYALSAAQQPWLSRS